jgi:geranylgeranyl diphosphate synthase type I
MERYAKVSDRALDRYLSGGDHAGLRQAMRWIPMAGGKRLRPVMAQMVGEAVAGPAGARAALPLGTALEVVHNFTLVHDDIMDRSSLRRGRLTVHEKWGEPAAINAGDALFALSIEVALDTPGSDRVRVEILREVAAMVRGIAEGQQLDMDFEKARSVTRSEYLRMVEHKTSYMFATGAYCAARAAGAPPRVAESLRAYGRKMGNSFQIQDDILDCLADQAKFGKPVGKDIRNGKRTLLAIDALETLKGADLRQFRSTLGKQDATDEEVAAAIGLIESSGALERTRAFADKEGAAAVAKLAVLRASPAREHLAQLVQFMTSRAV